MLTNKEELFGDVKVSDILGCSDHEMVMLKFLRGGSRAKSWNTTLDFRRADLGLFHDLLGRIPWDTAPGRRGAKNSWLIFVVVVDYFFFLPPAPSPSPLLPKGSFSSRP